MADATVTAFSAGRMPAQAEIVARLRQFVLSAAPYARESVVNGLLNYANGDDFAYIRVYKETVHLGFWNGATLDDPHHLLIGADQRMRHIKVDTVARINPATFTALLHQAAAQAYERRTRVESEQLS
jgi:hypothetical protein